MSNEDLCAAIQCGQTERFAELADQNGGLLHREVVRCVPLIRSAAVDAADLDQIALLTLYRAALAFDASRGCKFITYLSRCQRGQLLRALGWKHDGFPPLVSSLDEPLGDEDDGDTLLDRLQDTTATDPMEAVEASDLTRALEAALDRLPPDESAAVRAYELSASVPLEAVRSEHDKAIRHLRHDWLLRVAVEDYLGAYYLRTGVKAFQSGTSSSVERAVLRRERITEEMQAFFAPVSAEKGGRKTVSASRPPLKP